MLSYWQGLTANLAVVALVILLWSYIEDRLEESGSLLRQAVIGLVAAFGTLAVMLMPVVVSPGVVFDLRVTCIAVATFFAGSVAGLVTAAAALAYRAWTGGAGIWAGMSGVALAYLFAATARHLVKNRNLPLPGMAALGVLAAAANLAGLLVLPSALLAPTLAKMALPASTLTICGTVFACLILRQEFRRRELFRSNRTFRSLVEALPDCLNMKDRDGRFIAANSATAVQMGAPDVETLIGKSDFDFYPPETARQFYEDERAIVEGGAAYRIEQSNTRPDGSIKMLSTLKAPLRDAHGHLIGIITHNNDITERKRLECELAKVHERLDIALSNMADGLVMFEATGRIAMCNQRYRDLFPKTGHLRVAGADIGEVIRESVELGEERVANAEHLERIVADGCAFVRRAGTNLIPLGEDRWVESRTRVLADGSSLTVLSDVTDRKRAEEALALANRELHDLATTDSLTGLANRRRFDEVLERAFARSARDGAWLSLLVADVDRFKEYNDMYGHLAGDEGLRRISAILGTAVRRPLDTPARFGGEEFAVVLPDTDLAAARRVADAFRRAVEEAALKHARSDTGCLTVSVGVVSGIAGRTIPTAVEMIARADRALYDAKTTGRNRVAASTSGQLRRTGS